LCRLRAKRKLSDKNRSEKIGNSERGFFWGFGGWLMPQSFFCDFCRTLSFGLCLL